MVNEQKFLVTWIEAIGFIRGQATKTREEADRLFEHVKSTDAQYCEIRRIGSLVAKFGVDHPKGAN